MSFNWHELVPFNLSFKSEAAAKVGAMTTGGATVVTFIDQLSPYIRFASLIVTCLVGLATFAYYVPLAIEKWRNLRRK